MAPASTNGRKPSVPAKGLDEVIVQERLPAGRDALAEPLVARSQRERILVAMAESCAKKGYGATTITDICEPAGVSRATFYELFKDKEACFHAAMELALADAMGRIVDAYSAGQAVGDQRPRRDRRLPPAAGRASRLRPDGAGRGAVQRRPGLRALRLRQAGPARPARQGPRGSGRGDAIPHRAPGAPRSPPPSR